MDLVKASGLRLIISEANTTIYIHSKYDTKSGSATVACLDRKIRLQIIPQVRENVDEEG